MVGPVNNRPSQNKPQNFEKKVITLDLTRDTWHMKYAFYTWHVTHGVGWTFSQNLAPQVWRFGMDSVLKFLNKRITYSVNESVNDEDDCRTAPATPGQLNMRESWGTKTFNVFNYWNLYGNRSIYSNCCVYLPIYVTCEW